MHDLQECEHLHHQEQKKGGAKVRDEKVLQEMQEEHRAQRSPSDWIAEVESNF
jgi:hypothetical protein